MIYYFILLLTLIKGCPLKSKESTSVKKCYKTYTTTSSITTSLTTSSTSTVTMLPIITSTTSRSTSTMLPIITSTMSSSTSRTTSTVSTTSITLPTSTTSTSRTTSTVSTTSSVSSTSTTNSTNIDDIPITSGRNATLTYFTDTVTQCYGGDIPPGNGVAVNPLLLGFTLSDWNSKFSNTDPNNIPWCGKMLNVTVNGKTFSSRIIDTCNPGDEGEFVDPNTGQIIGGTCDYSNVIDLYGEPGRQFLQSTVGDDFYQGELEWVIY